MAIGHGPEQTEMLFDVSTAGAASAKPPRPEPERTEILFDVPAPQAAEDEDDGEDRTQLLDLRPQRDAGGGAAGSGGRAGAAAGGAAVAAAPPPPPPPPPSAAPGWLPPAPAGVAGPIRPSGHIVRMPMLGGTATVPTPTPAGGAWMFAAPVGPGGMPMLIHTAVATVVAPTVAAAKAERAAIAGGKAKAGAAPAQAAAGEDGSGSSAHAARSSSTPGATANSSYSSVQTSKPFAPLGPAAHDASWSSAPSSADFVGAARAASSQHSGSKPFEQMTPQERAAQQQAVQDGYSSAPRSSEFGALNTPVSQAQAGAAQNGYSSAPRSSEFGDLNTPVSQAQAGAAQNGYSSAPRSSEFGDLNTPVSQAQAGAAPDGYSSAPRSSEFGALNTPVSQAQAGAAQNGYSSAPRSSEFGALNTPVSQAQAGAAQNGYSSAPRSSEFGALNTPVSQAQAGAAQNGYSSAPRSSEFGDLNTPVSQAQAGAAPDGYSSAPRSSEFGALNTPVSQAQAGAAQNGYSSAPKSSEFGDLNTPVSQAQAGAAQNGYSSAPRSSEFGALNTPVSQAQAGAAQNGYSSAPSSSGFGALPPLFATGASQARLAPWPRVWNPTMRLHVKDGQRYRDMKKSAGNDPGFRFDDNYQQIETVYTYPQIVEQHGHTKFRPLFDQTLAEANGRTSPQPAADSLKYFGTASYVEQDRRERAWITRLSEQRLRNYNWSRYDAALGPVQTRRLEHGLAGAGRDRGVHNLLVEQGHQGFSIGEGQSEAESRRYLTDNMGRLKNAGVRTLYVEHARHREYQEIVDTWLQSPEPRLSGPLANYVDASDRKANLGGHGSLRGVFESAKANNIRVVGIDDPAANGHNTGKFRPEERAAILNPFAEHVVRSDQTRGDGKYVVLVRETHNNTLAGSRGGVPGVSQLLEIPAVKVADGKLVRDPEDTSLRRL